MIGFMRRKEDVEVEEIKDGKNIFLNFSLSLSLFLRKEKKFPVEKGKLFGKVPFFRRRDFIQQEKKNTFYLSYQSFRFFAG